MKKPKIRLHTYLRVFLRNRFATATELTKFSEIYRGKIGFFYYPTNIRWRSFMKDDMPSEPLP